MKKILIVLCLLFSTVSFADTQDDNSMTPEEQCTASGYVWEDGICVPPSSDEDTMEDTSSSNTEDL